MLNLSVCTQNHSVAQYIPSAAERGEEDEKEREGRR